jgi:ubiquinone/menaquinone biosynthesis C-methylase UbiE
MAATGSADANSVYSLGHSNGESARLQRQADELAPESTALLDRVVLRPGDHAVDLGCGPRGILEMLAERVSPGGRVVGVDADPAHVAMAAELVASLHLPGVEVAVGDARNTGLPSGAFDLVHARTLLINVPEPASIVAEMVRLAKPGGWVAVLEPDTEYSMCYPPLPAFHRVGELFAAAFARNGADPWIGRRVPELFRDAGLEDVAIEARPQLYPHGHSRRTIRVDLLQAMRPNIIDMGLATEPELEQLDEVVRTHLLDPRTVVMFGYLMLAWGRKPQ